MTEEPDRLGKLLDRPRGQAEHYRRYIRMGLTDQEVTAIMEKVHGEPPKSYDYAAWYRAEMRRKQASMTPTRLHECLQILGWSQRELADRIGMGERNARRWAKGEIEVPAAIAVWLESLAAVFAAHPVPENWRGQGRQPSHEG
jgi:hypothetical protein